MFAIARFAVTLLVAECPAEAHIVHSLPNAQFTGGLADSLSIPSSPNPSAPSKNLARVAVVGISLAVVALGSLSMWAAIVAQNGADGLSRAGVQTSGHLRAVQALSLIDTSTDALEERIVPADLRRLRSAQVVLDEALDRMESGGVIEARRLAGRAQPIVQRLKPAIERFLAKPPGFDSDGSSGAEEEMENIMSELSVLLNDLDSDPSQLLVTQLASVTATERTVRLTAFVLIPLGLSGVAACAWLLSLYRRRAEATMRGSLNAVIEDITDKARLERQQQESQRLEAVGRLAGGIAHDFNNLLTGVVGHAELIRTADSAAEVEESVDVILEASDRAASLVRQLLTFSRQQEFRSAEIDTQELMRRTAKLLGRVLGSDIVIDLQIEDAAPSIVADPSQIDQVLLNLAVNARDAMPEGGTLSLSVGRLSDDESWIGVPRRRTERVLPDTRQRHRRRDERRDGGANLSAFLHHQGRRPGHRARPRDHPWNRRSRKRVPPSDLGPRQRNHVRDPAPRRPQGR